MIENPFLGVWRRKFIQFGNGPVETSQQVLWIQDQNQFADVRSSPLSSLLTPEQYHQMDWRSRFDADLLGFAGEFTWQPEDEMRGTCTWHHKLAITPRFRPDTSRYHWLTEHEFLEQGTYEDETGQAHPFTEYWYRVHPGPVQCWQLNQAETKGQVLIAGSWAITVTQQKSVSASQPPKPERFPAFWATAWSLQSEEWCAEFTSTTSQAQDPIWSQILLSDYPLTQCSQPH